MAFDRIFGWTQAIPKQPESKYKTVFAFLF
jgi:hypothetical protein